jgi:hypothetical protein
LPLTEIKNIGILAVAAFLTFRFLKPLCLDPGFRNCWIGSGSATLGTGVPKIEFGKG